MCLCLRRNDIKDDLYDYCTSVRRTIREVLEEFRSVKIPKEYLFDLFPTLRPREFSIASSIRVRATVITLTDTELTYPYSVIPGRFTYALLL